jgi:DNA-binding LacI/PurR family transcriptional regulator
MDYIRPTLPVSISNPPRAVARLPGTPSPRQIYSLRSPMDILAVARRAGVSTATVSRVLNAPAKVRPATAARVRDAIAELNYVPNVSARSLRSGRSNLMGLLISDVRNPFFPDLIEHFESLAGQHGIDVTFINTGYSEERFSNGVRRLLERGVDGIAILTSELGREGIDRLKATPTPVVFLNQPSVIGNYPNIAVDYVKGFREAVDHLRMLGHRRIGFVAGPPTQSSAIRRRKAFLTALRQCGMEKEAPWIFDGDHRIAGGRYAAQQLFSETRPPTAVICSNDMTAVGVLQAALQLGRKIPDELSLIGFDDLFLAEALQPALTSLHLSRRELASRAFHSLYSAREQSLGVQGSVIMPHLVVRASTAAASGGMRAKSNKS